MKDKLELKRPKVPADAEVNVRIEENIEFALRVARDFARKRILSGVEPADFESAAMLGLCDASRRFDCSKGMNFRTFAYFRIKGAMLDLLRRSGKIPRVALRKIIAERQARLKDDEFSQQSANPDRVDGLLPAAAGSHTFPLPFAEAPAELADLTQTAALIGIDLIPGSPDGGGDLAYLHAQSPEQLAIGANLRRFIQKIMLQLTPDQRRVLEMRYFKDQSLEEIRHSFRGVSKSWLSRLHGHALENLREKLKQANEFAAARRYAAESELNDSERRLA